MATAIIPANQVIGLPGTALIVQLYRIPEIPNQVVFDIHRNGTRERNFTLVELRQVLADATQLLAAGLDPQRVPRLPALGKMEPGKWYFLPSGVIDPHHQHDFATPTIALAVNVK